MDMVRIVHNDYDKISDRVLWFNQDWALHFNVDLNKAYTTKSGSKAISNFHKEYGYMNEDRYAVKISRDFNYYLSIESTKRNVDGNKIVIRIGMHDLYFLKYKLDEVIKWFTVNNIFAKNKGKIFIPTKPNPIKVSLQRDTCYLEFEPCVIYNNEEEFIGVRCFLNSSTTFFFMNVNTLLTFNHFISNFNMYEAALSLVNYISRPENGTNYMDVDVNNNKPKGYFERVKNGEKRSLS